MPANPMGRGLPTASMVLPEEHAPEVPAEAGAAFLAVLETTQGKPVVGAIASAEAAVAAPTATASTVGDSLSDPVGEQLAAPVTPAMAPTTASTVGDRLSAPVDARLVAPGTPAVAPAPASTVGDRLSAPADVQLVAPAPPTPAPAPASTVGDSLSASADAQQAVRPTEARQVPAPTPTPTPTPTPPPATRPVRPRERATQVSTKVAAAPVAVDGAPLAPTPSEPPPAQAPDVATHVARATEAADASSASSVRAFGLRHVRLAVPTEDGAIRARVTVDRATETVDVAIRGTDDVGLTASRRVSELREGLAQHGLKLGSFDASAISPDVPRASSSDVAPPSTPDVLRTSPPDVGPDLLQQDFDGSEHPTDSGSEHGPNGDAQAGPTGEGTQTTTSSTDEAPHHDEAPPRRTPNRWDDDATVGQFLDLRI